MSVSVPANIIRSLNLRNYVITEGMSYMNESKKNGTNRKKLYFKFVDWAKEKNQRNVFGNIFEWKAFTEKYPFMPMEMRYLLIRGSR